MYAAYFAKLYYFYMDESGVDTLVKDTKKHDFGYDWFTTGGLIVDDQARKAFENVHASIIDRYFSDNEITLPNRFKLHYSELRQKKHPYDKLPGTTQRHDIANDIFNAICNIDCTLISVSINKVNHMSRYTQPANVRAYTLLACLERFQFFLEDRQSEGIAYYESFTNSMRRMITSEMLGLRSIIDFYPTLGRIKGKVKNGNPYTDVLLQISDFFVYAPHIKAITRNEKQDRWRQVQHKYYRGRGWKRKGFVVL